MLKQVQHDTLNKCHCKSLPNRWTKKSIETCHFKETVVTERSFQRCYSKTKKTNCKNKFKGSLPAESAGRDDKNKNYVFTF